MQQPELIHTFLRKTLAELIRVTGPILARQAGSRKVALIGPTGVGKTTTIAKLTADYLMHYGERVALITMDTYRVAAVEQLKVYGELMNVPVDVVVSPEQMATTLDRHRDKELILIDTAGRSPRDEVSLRDMQNFLRSELGTENHLVLSATTRDRDLYDTVNRFRFLPLQSLIFTKVDECDCLGSLVNVVMRHNYPISYVTTGQQVPEDLILADSAQLAEMILGHNR
jgi:flagellar biosynthesis protein FlhF